MKRIIRNGRGALAAGLIMTATPALAGPPLVTDDAGIVDRSHLEVELNGAYVHDSERTPGAKIRHTTGGGEIKLTTGISKNVGVSLTTPYTFSDRERINGDLVGSASGFGDMLLELKYVVYDRDGLALTLKPTLLIPIGRYGAGLSEGRWQPGVTLIATKEFHDGAYALHANAGYERHDYRTEKARAENRGDLWSVSLAGEDRITGNLTAMLDFGVARSGDRSTSTPAVYALAGARYEVNKFLDIDCGIKAGLTKPEDDVAALYGIVLKF